MFFYQELVLLQVTRAKKVDISHSYYLPSQKIRLQQNLFLQMMQVIAIQIAPADNQLLLLVDHIMG